MPICRAALCRPICIHDRVCRFESAHYSRPRRAPPTNCENSLRNFVASDRIPGQPTQHSAMKSIPLTRIPHLATVARFLLCCILALTFVAPFVALTASASIAACPMACCTGINAGHCSSGVPLALISPLDTEVLCGSPEAKTIARTVEVEPTTQELSTSAATAVIASFSNPCHIDCRTGLVALRRTQPRDAIVRSISPSHSLPHGFLWAVSSETLPAGEAFVTGKPSRGPPSATR